MTRGLYVFLSFVWKMNWIFFLTPFFILFLHRSSRILLLLWVFLSQIAYSVYVGGDAWESWGGSNRYISLGMPLYFIG
ncbi:MAG: hypothetical protein V1244_06040, partial [Nitrospinaceae bacterium]|nr:hypothetical protein [Nitrospinaceae bacterium]